MAELKRVLGFWTILSLAIASIMGTGMFFGAAIGSSYSGNGESWSLGEYALLGGISLAVFAAIWGLCVRGGRWLRLRFGPRART